MAVVPAMGVRKAGNGEGLLQKTGVGVANNGEGLLENHTALPPGEIKSNLPVLVLAKKKYNKNWFVLINK
jgi:hypothetical protein